jgi:hypothetical protein
MLVPGVEVRISVREYFIAGGALAAEAWSASRRTCMDFFLVACGKKAWK